MERIALRARNNLWATFFLMGLLAMAWVPRIPEIKEDMGLSDGLFGLVLLGSTIGSVPGAQIAGRLVHNFATKKVARFCALIMPLGLFLIGNAKNPWELFLGLFVIGVAFSALDVAANVQAVAIEHISKRRYMSSFHALWSVGAFVSAFIGGAIAKHVSPEENLKGMAIFALLAFLIAIPGLLNGDLDGHKGDAGVTKSKVPLFSKEAMPLWGLGIGLMASFIPESGIYDWSGILLKEHMNVGKGITAAAATAFSLGMIVSRFLGDRWFEKWGHQNTVRVGGQIAGIALGTSLLIALPLSKVNALSALIIICLGFAITGLCIGPFFPAFNLAAMSVPGVAPSVGMARVAVIAIAAYFAGPTAIGGISEATSLPIAFFLLVVLLFIVARQSKYIYVKEIEKTTEPKS